MCYLYVKSPTSILYNCFLIVKLFKIIKAVWKWGKCMWLVWKDSNHLILGIIKKWMKPECIQLFTLLLGFVYLCWNCERYPLLSHIRNLRINITEKTAWMEILSEIKLGCLLANMKWPCIEYMGCADTFTTLDISQINIGILLLELRMSL